MITFRFDAEKAVEVLLYITQYCQDVYNALKILYFADKEHLRRYGRPICGGSYDAMEYGPVPKEVYTIVRHVRGDNAFPTPIDATQALHMEDRRTIAPERPPDMDYFSKSDIEVLNEAIRHYAPLDFNEMHEIARRDPAYIAVGGKGDIPVEEIIRHMSNAEDVLEYLNCP